MTGSPCYFTCEFVKKKLSSVDLLLLQYTETIYMYMYMEVSEMLSS